MLFSRRKSGERPIVIIFRLTERPAAHKYDGKTRKIFFDSVRFGCRFNRNCRAIRLQKVRVIFRGPFRFRSFCHLWPNRILFDGFALTGKLVSNVSGNPGRIEFGKGIRGVLTVRKSLDRHWKSCHSQLSGAHRQQSVCGGRVSGPLLSSQLNGVGARKRRKRTPCSSVRLCARPVH